jgi:cell wall-associated NlpC family hydrolase
VRELPGGEGPGDCVLRDGVRMQVSMYHPGDILCINRGIYKHYGIYAGNSKVIHYSAINGDFGTNISVYETSFEQFRKDGKCEIYEIPKNISIRQYSPEETLRRARSRLGEKSYNLLFNNCEHFALWCKTGISLSRQVTHAAGAAVLIGAAIIASYTIYEDERI